MQGSRLNKPNIALAKALPQPVNCWRYQQVDTVGAPASKAPVGNHFTSPEKALNSALCTTLGWGVPSAQAGGSGAHESIVLEAFWLTTEVLTPALWAATGLHVPGASTTLALSSTWHSS